MEIKALSQTGLYDPKSPISLPHVGHSSPPGSLLTIQGRKTVKFATEPGTSGHTNSIAFASLFIFCCCCLFCFVFLYFHKCCSLSFAFNDFCYWYETCPNTNITVYSTQFAITFLGIQFPATLCDVKQGPPVFQNM